MILLLDTSTPICYLTLIRGEDQYAYSWQADRTLALDLLSYIRDRLNDHEANLQSLTGVGLMKGPGSFTGLRIGATVANTLTRELAIPIVGTVGETWRQDALARLKNGESDELVLPDYGRPARITTPKK